MNAKGKNKTISILGCGWLGFPLAKLLLKKCWQVKGSTTSVEKLNLLEEAEIEPFLMQLGNPEKQIDEEFFNSDFLLINIPPSRKTAQIGYLAKMQMLLPFIQASTISKIIFIGSTSVYADVCREVTEEEPTVQSELLQAEMLFLADKNFDTKVIRFGGLFGPSRNPGRFFRDKKSIANGLAPVNLIHLNDCIGLIEAVLNQPEFKSAVYHAAAPTHPSRKEFYEKAMSKSGLAVPEFIEEKNDWKIINPKKIIEELNYRFKFPDLLACLDDPAAF